MLAQDISLDVGGTFTDFFVKNRDNTFDVYKSLTTPHDISEGIFNGLKMIAERRGLTLEDLVGGLASLSCGTTVATNAILEKKVATTALICTEGFRDTLLIREGGKENTYNLNVDYPEPYIPRRLTFPVRERINAEGGIKTPLDEVQVREIVRTLKAWDVEAIAVSLLWSVVNPAHELRIGEIIAEEWPEVPFSLGHRVNPTIREYRRTSATAIDASLKPVVEKKLSHLQDRLADNGFKGVLTLVISSGGRTSLEEVLRQPVQLCLSGPSAISQAGMLMARHAGVEHGNVVTVDMGGTSFDVAITTNWTTPLHRVGKIGDDIFGVPSVEVLTVGAGGGSLARVDSGGFIHVGPESAGSTPGPASYGRGGEKPTVTDANLVAGFFDPDDFGDGQMHLSVDAARQAIKAHVADPLDMSVEDAASLIRHSVEQNMVSAIEAITVRRGLDPRQFILVAGGSAAGTHIAAIARELGMKEIGIPRAAGVLAAYGIGHSDIRFNYGRSLATNSQAFDREAVNDVLAELAEKGNDYLSRMRVPEDRRELHFSAQAGYAGQVWHLTLPLSRSRFETEADLAALVEDFHQLHERTYSVRAPDDVVEFLEWNVMAVGVSPVPPSPALVGKGQRNQPEASGARPIYISPEHKSIECPVYDLASVAGHSGVINGPALIQEKLTVIFVPDYAHAEVFASGDMLLTLDLEN